MGKSSKIFIAGKLCYSMELVDRPDKLQDNSIKN